MEKSMTTEFVCILQSAKLSQTDLDLIITAVSMQLHDDYAPAWERLPPTMSLTANGIPTDTQKTRYVTCYFRDHTSADPDGALAYHWVNPDVHRAEIVILVDIILSQPNASRDDVSIALGHECIECAEDSATDEWSDRGDGTEEALEAVDRVQGYSYSKAINGQTIKVTDFLLPAAFDNDAPPGTTYDFCNKLTSARQVGEGGYTITRSVGKEDATVTGNMQTAHAYSHKTLEKHGVK
jgi:hypothetical protein